MKTNFPLQTKKKRGNLNVGYPCNSHCIFCRQGKNKKRENTNDKTTAEIKKEMKKMAKDCRGLVLTGGEPTLRTDFLELVTEAKKNGFELIQIQTNGRMFAYLDFCQKTIEAGANEFYPGLHGHIPELHDFLTGAKGSFQQTVQGIRNLKRLDQQVCTNTVITKYNYRHLPEIAKLLISLGVDQHKFAFIYPFSDGRCLDDFDSIVPLYREFSKYIERILKVAEKTTMGVTIADVPLCVMPKKIRKPELMGELGDYFNLVVAFGENKGRIGKETFSWNKMRKNDLKTKGPNCHLCKFDNICEGIWKIYAERKGFSELKPIR